MIYVQIIIAGQHNKYADYISKLTTDKPKYPHLSVHRSNPKTKTHKVSKSDLLSYHHNIIKSPRIQIVNPSIKDIM